MIRVIKIFNVILAILLLIALGFILGNRYNVIIDKNHHLSLVSQSTDRQKIQKLFDLIDQQYIKDIDSDSLIDITLNRVLNDLDPHSSYLNPDKNAKSTDISGEFTGLGIEYYIYNDTVTIIRNFENSPNADYFLPGDKILTINGLRLNKDNASHLGTILQNYDEFQLNLKRGNELKKVSVKKEQIPIKNVESTYEIAKNIGYIRLSHFSNNAYQEFHNALVHLKELGINSVIIDLRDNGGGLLNQAEKIADEFLPKGNTIVYLQSDRNKEKEYFYATSNGVFINGKVYVLINEHSASASEVLAGALQDNDRATIIGRRSFGKGLVQKEITMDDGSTFRLTVAKYYTPSGRCIQKEYGDSQNYNDELLNRYYSGEMYSERKIHQIDSLKRVTPKGKIVYGGGGITPDEYVALKQYDFGNNFYVNDGGSIIKNQILEDISNNIPEYYAISKEEFIRNYEPTRLYENTFNALKNNQIVLLEKSKNLLKYYIKAYVAKVIYGEDAYLRIWNQKDDIVQKALEIAKS